MTTTVRSKQHTMKFKMGWIEKKSKHLGIWRNRWIEAYNGDKLCSFKHKSRSSPSEIIDLSYIHKAYKSNLSANEFVIAYFEDCNIKSRRFRTSTSGEANEWINFFNQSIKRNQHCASCDCLDQQIMSRFHVSDRRHDRIRSQSISDSQFVTNKFMPKNKKSLDAVMEDIAFDVTHCHQYLKVVLESKSNRTLPAQNSCN